MSKQKIKTRKIKYIISINCQTDFMEKFICEFLEMTINEMKNALKEASPKTTISIIKR